VRVRYPEGVSTIADASLNLDRDFGSQHARGNHPRSAVPALIRNRMSARSWRNPPSRPHAIRPDRLPRGSEFRRPDQYVFRHPVRNLLTENLQAEANLRLRGTASNPALIGRISITQGRWFSSAPKFTINQGSIAFYNPLRVEPVLDVDLETRARGIDVMLTVAGPLNKLNLTPRSDPPLQFNEIVALLATGRNPTSDPALLAAQSTTPQSWQQMGASALLGQAISSPVAGRLQRFSA